MTFALAGNQNSGKTTLFNKLTGANQHVGNWPGVTVEKKEGLMKHFKDVSVVDLPGVYSLSPYTFEEVISREFIAGGEADAIINIVDATNIERNLYLSLQLSELGKPMIIALNMMDELEKSGDKMNVEVLEQLLGIPVVPISARTGAGLEKLSRRALETVKRGAMPNVGDICGGHIHEAIHSITHLAENRARANGIPPKFAAGKLFEGDGPMREKLGLNGEELHIIDEIIHMAERKLGMRADAALADARYSFVEKLVGQCLIKRDPEGKPTFSNKLDDILTHRIWAIPIFIAVMGATFWITFGPIGSFFTDGFKNLIEQLIGSADAAVRDAGASEWLHGLIFNGVLAGIGAVLSFLPLILVLFLCFSLLEDSGYMARAAYVLDRILRRTGLSGRSVIPMVMGFGCSVPAVMACRAMQNERDRRLTIFITPFMSCGAKVPIYAMITAAFFPKHGAFVFGFVYLLGVFAAVVSAILLSRLKAFKGRASPFIMELPPYRPPSPRSVGMLLFHKAKGFMARAFTVILAGTFIIWFLSGFDFGLRFTDAGSSMLASIAGVLSHVFKPLGFGTWEATTAVLSGFTAKEAVVSTMAVVYNVSADGLPARLSQHFTTSSALSFTVFNLLCMPCVAAVSSIRQELGSIKWTLAALGYQTGIAWIFALAVYIFGEIILG